MLGWDLKNYEMIPYTTHCTELSNYGGGTAMPRKGLDSPYVPVIWRVALFGRLRRRLAFVRLIEIDLGP